MKPKIKMIRPAKPAVLSSAAQFGRSEAEKAIAFHETFPGYEPTRLACLSNLAKLCGVSGIYVKDESSRFGLNAFKALGGSYAVGRYIAERLGKDIGELDFGTLTSPEVKAQLEEITFITATDGNHGRGIAWTARQLGQKCVVYMPAGSTEERLENIRALGAEACITDLSYDEAVRKAGEDAEKNGWVLVQDTAWPGYEKIPVWIMQGYTTLALETVRQLGGVKPTHLFLQAGVGSFSGAADAFFADYYGEEARPKVIIAEPDKADCVFRTAAAMDGKLHTVTAKMDTIMAGLACGVPSSVGWEILRDHADFFVSMSDECAADGMRILGNPLGDDPRVISGESGAAGFGLAAEVLLRPEFASLKEQLGLNEDSVILCISTEGDTDRRNYRDIVWRGAWAGI